MKKALSISHELLCIFKFSLQIDENSPSGLTWIASRGKIKPGTFAGTLRLDGYWQVCFNRKIWQNHRIVWALANNSDPGQFQIDHIDGDPSNNHPDNLRLATCLENTRNRANRQSNNTSGITGVDWSKIKRQWRVRVKIKGQEILVGYYDSLAEAAEMRRAAELQYYKEFAPIKK